MSVFFYQGKRVEPKTAKVIEVHDDGNRYEIRVFNEKFKGCGFSIYYLPKNRLKKTPKSGDTITTYDFCSEVVGCDLNREIQFRDTDLKEAIG